MRPVLRKLTRGRLGGDADVTLATELERNPRWMYPWALADGRVAPILGPELPSIHDTRTRMIEPHARAALTRSDATAIDLGCSEGWFAHRLLDWGADHVTGIDAREVNIRRARLIQDHYGIPRRRLTYRCASVYDPMVRRFEAADVVLCLGLIYHLEDPIGALRIARHLTRRTCIVETQASLHVGASRYTWGTTGEYLETEAAWSTHVEPVADQDLTTLASVDRVVSLIPNRAALVEAMTAAGFVSVSLIPGPPDGNRQYVDEDRLVAVGAVASPY
jgi:tRNA (mo5U34)-methyltransferase